jgi:hypothetical protein
VTLAGSAYFFTVRRKPAAPAAVDPVPAMAEA